eukprot:scaffold17871_cov82-Phaeocystis_antarctica.AAC.5
MTSPGGAPRSTRTRYRQSAGAIAPMAKSSMSAMIGLGRAGWGRQRQVAPSATKNRARAAARRIHELAKSHASWSAAPGQARMRRSRSAICHDVKGHGHVTPRKETGSEATGLCREVPQHDPRCRQRAQPRKLRHGGLCHGQGSRQKFDAAFGKSFFELNTTGRLSPEIVRKKVTSTEAAAPVRCAHPPLLHVSIVRGRFPAAFLARESTTLPDFLRDALGVPPAPAGQVRVLGERNKPRK